MAHDAILGRRHGDGRHPGLHREIVRREAGVVRAVRAQLARAIREHRRAFVTARGEARRGGRQLLRILDKLPPPD
jgi:hypothetical protein